MKHGYICIDLYKCINVFRMWNQLHYSDLAYLFNPLRSVSVFRMSRREINVHNLLLFHLGILYTANVSDDRKKKKKRYKRSTYTANLKQKLPVRYKCVSFVVCIIVLSSRTIWEQSQLNFAEITVISYCKTCIDSEHEIKQQMSFLYVAD